MKVRWGRALSHLVDYLYGQKCNVRDIECV